MTANDRAQMSVTLSEQIAEFLQQQGKALDAGTLVQRFCDANDDVSLTAAEVALSLLLNQRRVIIDDDMLLESKVAEAA